MSLIASVLHLDRAAIKALRITDAYSLHRVVYSLYERQQSEHKQGSGILYADQGGDFTGRKILLLANRTPATSVQGLYGTVRSRSIPDDFLEHENYRFKVIINPARRNSATHKIVPVKGRAAVAQWFAERSVENWGFSVGGEHLQVDHLHVLQFKGKQQSLITLAQAHVQGQLKVTDREQFRTSFCHGIGRGRAFGCGLLQIVPLIDTIFA